MTTKYNMDFTHNDICHVHNIHNLRQHNIHKIQKDPFNNYPDHKFKNKYSFLKEEVLLILNRISGNCNNPVNN